MPAISSLEPNTTQIKFWSSKRIMYFSSSIGIPLKVMNPTQSTQNIAEKLKFCGALMTNSSVAIAELPTNRTKQKKWTSSWANFYSTCPTDAQLCSRLRSRARWLKITTDKKRVRIWFVSFRQYYSVRYILNEDLIRQFRINIHT